MTSRLLAETGGRKLLAETESVCPVCLQRLEAQRVAEGNDVYLVKHCPPQHGLFKTIVWRGLESYRAWGARGSAYSEFGGTGSINARIGQRQPPWLA